MKCVDTYMYLYSLVKLIIFCLNFNALCELSKPHHQLEYHKRDR